MKLRVRIPLIIGLIVVITAASIIIAVEIIIGESLEGVVRENLLTDLDRLDTNEFELVVRHIRRVVLLIGLICTFVGIATAILIGRTIATPMVSIAEKLKDISEGAGDLTRHIDISSKDEIGDLAWYFNLTLEKIKKLVIHVKIDTVSLSETGNNMAYNAEQTAAANHEITANINSTREQITKQAASVEQVRSEIEQITVNINTLNENIENQSSSVSETSDAIEEMIANVSSVSAILVDNARSMKELLEASGEGRSDLQEVATDFREIARESEGLIEINAVMENIASQTNLLSMNAAIEAAHAGEAGKGFAVAAGEIRKLAESSSEQSKTISQVLKKIKESIDKITASTNTVQNKFQTIDGGVATVSRQLEDIRKVMEKQAEGNLHIHQVFNHLSGISAKVKSGSEEMRKNSVVIAAESKNLFGITHEITGGMAEMALGADQVNSAINQVSDISVQTKKIIDILVNEVARFKVD